MKVGRTSPLVLASTKSRAGHAEPASGAVGILAAVAAAGDVGMRPNLHLRELSPHLAAVMSKRASSSAAAAFMAPRQHALVVPSVAAGVSSVATGTSAFAFQGTNAHMTLTVQAGEGCNAGAVNRSAVALWDRGRHWITHPGHPMFTGVSSMFTGKDTVVHLQARIGHTASLAGGLLRTSSRLTSCSHEPSPRVCMTINPGGKCVYKPRFELGWSACYQ